MADPTHLAELLKGVESWNAWREAHPGIEHPDLSGVDFTDGQYRDTPIYTLNSKWVAVIYPCSETLQGENRWKANLRYANLRGANLQGTNLWGANLEYANLSGANLQGTNLWGTNLQDGDLTGANLAAAFLFGANLQGADLQSARLPAGYLSGANLQGADFRRANLQGGDLTGVNLQRARLSGANLQGAKLAAANLQGAELLAANLEGANVIGVRFSRGSWQRKFQGIRVSTCYGNQIFKSFAQDQDYIETLRASGRWGAVKFWIWYIFADCGRSFLRWGLWSVGIAIFFGLIYFGMGPEHIKVDNPLPFSWLTMMYYSVVTFTTLGFGDIKPATETAAMVVMAEVILGYIMLGGLIAIFANKVARRS